MGSRDGRPAASWGARLFGIAMVFATAVPGASAEGEDARLPVPEQPARNAAAAELKKELKDDLRAKEPEAKQALARKLLEREAAGKGDAAARYVLLEQAATLAEEARDVGLALEVAARFAEKFQMQKAARGVASVDAIAKGSKEAGVLVEAANACIELTGEALAADDVNTAGKSAAAAKTHAKAAKLGGLAARAGEIGELIAAFRRQAVAAEAARTTLGTTPEDPAAHETLGKFLCFGRGRWDEGLAHVAKSSNAALAQVAAKDLERSADAAARQAVADGWWDLAQKEKDPLAKARMLARAGAIYEATPAEAPAERAASAKTRVDSITYWAWNRGVALTKDFSKDGPASLGLATIRAFIAQQHIDKKSDGWKTKLPRFPEVAFSKTEEYVWRLETNQGPISIRFFPDTAPKHVANFLYLTELGFFDDTEFHRVIPGFMAQGGSPLPKGAGGPGYSFAGEFGGSRKHDKPGVLSMANAGPGTDSSQFFITFGVAAHLDGMHTIFGEVIDGMDAVKKLEAQGTQAGPPKTQLTLISATVTAR